MILSNIQRKVTKVLGFDKRYWNNRPNGLYSFNYHRIGNKSETRFDPNVFSCTEALFEKHITFFQKNFDVVNNAELIGLINDNKLDSGKYALLTFDDGYIDNYTAAYPLLKKAKCPATMYIATDFIDKSILPWWDEAAWLVRNNNSTIFNGLNWDLPKNIKKLPIAHKIKYLLRAIKDDKTLSIDSKFSILRTNAEHTYDGEKGSERLFMSWDMLREMSNNNIDIGSQTCSHQILSHLSEIDQRYEIEQSKSILEQKIGTKIRSFAYPVGGISAFTSITQNIVKDAGYDFALSFIPNINTSSNFNRFGLNRFSIDNDCSSNDIKAYISDATKKL